MSKDVEDTNKIICICRSIPSGRILYRLEYAAQRFVDAVTTTDDSHLIVVALNSKRNEALVFHRLDSGEFQLSSRPKFSEAGAFRMVVALPTHVPYRVGLIDEVNGTIWDCRKRCVVRTLPGWNGVHTKDGRLGLCAPSRGGLGLIDLRTGETVYTLVPRVAEGVFSTRTLFSVNDKHVIYYHSRKRSIRVFRLADGEQIADYKTHAEITDLVSAHHGKSLVLGAIDGSVVVLALADIALSDYIDFLGCMHSYPLVSDRSVDSL